MNEIKETKDLLKITAVVDDEEVAKYEEQQKKMELEKAYELYIKSGVPAKFFDKGLRDFIAETEGDKKNQKIVVDFALNPERKMLILYGKQGRGKTHLACGIIKNYGGCYITASTLCIEYEAATSYHAKRSRMEILHFYSTEKLVVIDECNKYSLNPELEKFLLSYIVCTRYENDLPTVLITNTEIKPFIEFLGRTAYDRIQEVCTTLKFEGESKR
jgi:DNA replication protein DnaC